MTERYKECLFELVKPEAKFMFTAVLRCRDCGNTSRPDKDAIEHAVFPASGRDLLNKYRLPQAVDAHVVNPGPKRARGHRMYALRCGPPVLEWWCFVVIG